jgi:phosphoribosyl 1,2-cyclic phosphodiesterase
MGFIYGNRVNLCGKNHKTGGKQLLEAAFLGTSGSCAFNSGKRARYGTNTSCVAVRVGDDVVVFDAGSGICGLDGLAGFKSEKVSLFLSHYHADHIQGLLFWDAFFDPAKSIDVFGMRAKLGGVKDVVDGYLSEPFHPVGIDDARAVLSFCDLAEGQEVVLSGGGVVRVIGLSHPNGCLGFRLDFEGKSVCYITDVELSDHKDNSLADFCKDTDLLIVDAFFGTQACITGWGHSSASECAGLAKKAGAKRLALFHYRHTDTDDDIDKMEQAAKAEFAGAFASFDGLVITL